MRIKLNLLKIVSIIILPLTTLVTPAASAFPNTPQTALNFINNLIYNNTNATKYIYQAGPNFHIPMLNANGTLYSKGVDTRLVMIPNASRFLRTTLFADTHWGPAARCELNLGAYTPETKQQSELTNVIGAWNATRQPEFMINANFFDVRPQIDKNSACSSPLGTYLDSNDFGPARNLLSTFSIPYAGENALTDSSGNTWTALSTMFFTQGEAPQIIEPKDSEDNDAAKNMVYAKLLTGRIFTAVAGIRLLSPTFRAQLNDIGTRQTARSAVGYVRKMDMLVLFQSSDYNNGYTLDMVQDFYRAINAESALGFDGGSSSSLLIRNQTNHNWQGADANNSSCREAYCSPKPVGNSLPMSPSWIGFSG